MMGSADQEKPVHPVTFAQPFYLGETEVTFAQYDAFARATGRPLPADRSWGRDHQPVIDVSWSDVRAYAHWLGAMTGTTCRLPSEAEWEYACGAGTTKAYALPAKEGGSDSIAGKGLANCRDCGSQWDDCRFRRKPVTCSELMSAIVPI
jgi:formylglycine-generating enzyme required for sulfatase activity